MATDPISLMVADAVGPIDHCGLQLVAWHTATAPSWSPGNAVSDAHLYYLEAGRLGLPVRHDLIDSGDVSLGHQPAADQEGREIVHRVPMTSEIANHLV